MNIFSAAAVPALAAHGVKPFVLFTEKLAGGNKEACTLRKTAGVITSPDCTLQGKDVEMHEQMDNVQHAIDELGLRMTTAEGEILRLKTPTPAN